MSRGSQALAVVLAASAVLTGNAWAGEMTIEGETLDVAAAVGGARGDAAATGSRTLGLFSTGVAEGSFTTTEPMVHLAIVARGTQCDGAPVLQVSVDGVRRLTGSVGSTAYSEHGANLFLAPGDHTIRVAFVNDFRRAASLLAPGCDRNAFLDRISFFPRPFAAGSFAARPLAPDAPADPESDRFVAELLRLRDYVYPGIGRMPVTTSTRSYGVPVYAVTAHLPKVRVTVERPQNDPGGQGLEDKMAAVPLPAWAEPSKGTDRTLVVWQPSTGRMWEMWGLARDILGRPSIRWGGYVEDVERFPGHFGGPWPQTNWGVAASKIELLAGLQTIAELRAGVIAHPVSVHLPAVDTSGWRWPAQGTDTTPSRMPGIIREGMRFRLPAGLDIDALGLSPYARIVARAVQRHGMIVTDHSARCICFAAEDPAQYPADPYTGESGIFGGDRPDFSGFPWSELELVAVPD